MQALLKCTADGHSFADAFHLSVERGVSLLKFLESEARNLGDDVVNGGLEAGRRFAGDVVWNLIEGVADSEFGGNFRDRKPGRFGGKG